MHDDSEEFVQPIRVLSIINGIEQAQLERERDAICELDVFAEVLLVLESLKVQCEDIWQPLDLHALFSLL